MLETIGADSVALVRRSLDIIEQFLKDLSKRLSLFLRFVVRYAMLVVGARADFETFRPHDAFFDERTL